MEKNDAIASPNLQQRDLTAESESN